MNAIEINFCQRCGSRIAPRAHFCEDCGAPLVNQQPLAPPAAVQPAPKKTSRAGLWIGIVLLLAAACGAVMIGLYFLL
jgi:hypothetical protein